jgi:hypothetical protein
MACCFSRWGSAKRSCGRAIFLQVTGCAPDARHPTTFWCATRRQVTDVRVLGSTSTYRATGARGAVLWYLRTPRRPAASSFFRRRKRLRAVRLAPSRKVPANDRSGLPRSLMNDAAPRGAAASNLIRRRSSATPVVARPSKSRRVRAVPQAPEHAVRSSRRVSGIPPLIVSGASSGGHHPRAEVAAFPRIRLLGR